MQTRNVGGYWDNFLIMGRVLHVKDLLLFEGSTCWVVWSSPVPTPKSCGVEPELLCSEQPSRCVFYSCASVIVVQPGRQLLSFALPLETLPCRLEEWNGCYGCCGGGDNVELWVDWSLCGKSGILFGTDAVAHYILQVESPWHPWLYSMDSMMCIEIECE